MMSDNKSSVGSFDNDSSVVTVEDAINADIVKKKLLAEQIDQWERNSIEIIQEKAKDCREIVIKSSQPYINDIKKKFNNLNEQIKQFHSENDFNEINLIYLRNRLIKITQALNNSLNIYIQEDSKSFINEIAIISEKKPKFNKWKQDAITVAGGNLAGQKLNQFNCPAGIFIDKKKNIFIVDCANHRVVEWKYNTTEVQIIAGGNGKGNRMNQLNYPQGIIVDRLGQIYVADSGNSRIMRWCEGKEEGEVIVGGNQRHQLHGCHDLSFEDEGNLYVVDLLNYRIVKFEII
ncbi:unnamed protein product [Adineta steineri]|uniref:NHL repeat containing protein n=1 Tax=Adineta steineri TaxID=433720 RepID=A0A815EIC2_9BILA|nr:unnamed protein product [Adineta steineri]